MPNSIYPNSQKQSYLNSQSLPHFPSLKSAFTTLFGNNTKVIQSTPVAGGDINAAYRLELSDGTYIFMKSNAKKNLSFFTAEATGIEAVARTGAIGTPTLLCTGTDESRGGSSFLLMEWIQGGSRLTRYWKTFAHQLAAMHQASAEEVVSGAKYGFYEDNYIGAGEQVNTMHDSWVTFFRDCRLEPQFRRAGHYLGAVDQKKALWLLDHLDDFLVEPEKPSLLHGDLWSGNVITGDDGKAWLIDPAVYVGHAEADIAMTELFGGFPREFYAAYREAGLLQPDYDRRRDLYNLYHLLNHLNLFGRSYLSSVRRIVNEYVP